MPWLETHPDCYVNVEQILSIERKGSRVQIEATGGSLFLVECDSEEDASRRIASVVEWISTIEEMTSGGPPSIVSAAPK